MRRRIAVLGAGAGGQATAAHLRTMGCDVVLYEHVAFSDNAAAIGSRGSIRLEGAIETDAEVEVRLLDDSCNIGDEDLFFLVVPSFAQEAYFGWLLPRLDAQRTLLIVNGNFGSLVLRRYAEIAGKSLPCLAGETDSLVYGCTVLEPGVVRVTGIKSSLSISALPTKRTAELADCVRDYLPTTLLPAANVIEIGLSNPNMILHCPTMLLNLARMEAPDESFSFYAQGVTPSVAKVMEEMDRERVSIGKALGLRTASTLDWLRRTYSLEADDLFTAIVSNPVYRKGPSAPQSFRHRFIAEDVPDSLVPVVSLGDLVGVDAATIRAVITLASVVNSNDYMMSGRTIEKLGLTGLSASEALNTLR